MSPNERNFGARRRWRNRSVWSILEWVSHLPPPPPCEVNFFIQIVSGKAFGELLDKSFSWGYPDSNYTADEYDIFQQDDFEMLSLYPSFVWITHIFLNLLGIFKEMSDVLDGNVWQIKIDDIRRSRREEVCGQYSDVVAHTFDGWPRLIGQTLIKCHTQGEEQGDHKKEI